MSVPLWFKRDIHLGMSGPDVRIVRRKMGFPENGTYDLSIQRAVMGLGKAKNLDASGDVTADVASELGESADASLPPDWWMRDNDWEYQYSDMGPDVQLLNAIAGINDDRFTIETEAWVRRLQSAHDVPLTGRINLDLAKVIGSSR